MEMGILQEPLDVWTMEINSSFGSLATYCKSRCNSTNDKMFCHYSGDDWEGQLMFDQKRHKTILNLPLIISINQFPEWFTLDQDAIYSIESNQKQQWKI